MNKYFIGAVLNLLLISGCNAEKIEGKMLEVTMSGAVLKVSALAYAKFNASLIKNGGDVELSNFLNKIDNYDVLISESPITYSIEIYPKKYKGTILKGGGGRYIFGKEDFNLIEEKYYK